MSPLSRSMKHELELLTWMLTDWAYTGVKADTVLKLWEVFLCYSSASQFDLPMSTKASKYYISCKSWLLVQQAGIFKRHTVWAFAQMCVGRHNMLFKTKEKEFQNFLGSEGNSLYCHSLVLTDRFPQSSSSKAHLVYEFAILCFVILCFRIHNIVAQHHTCIATGKGRSSFA